MTVDSNSMIHFLTLHVLNISSIFNQVLLSFVNPTLFLKDILMYKMVYYLSLQALFSLFTDLVYYQNNQINIELTMMRFFAKHD